MLVFDLLLLGVVITLEPIPLTAFILVLASKNGARKGAAFILGWLASLVAVIALTLLLTGNDPPRPQTAPSLAALAVKILVGVVLVAIGARRWRRMGQPKPAKKTPRWQTGIENMSPWFAMALGVLTQPWGLVAAGVAIITGAKLSSWQDYFVLFMFCLISTATYIAMEIYAVAKPAQTQQFLTKTRSWVDTHTDQAIVILSLALGCWLVGQSLFVILS